MVGSVDLRNMEIPDSNWTFDWDFDVKRGQEGLKDPERPKSSKIVNPLSLQPTNEKHSRELLSAEHLFLMCPVILAFALQIKTLSTLDLWSDTHGR